MADEAEVNVEAEGEDQPSTPSNNPVSIKTTAKIEAVDGKFRTTTTTIVVYADGTKKEKTEIVDGKVRAKRKITSTPATGSSSTSQSRTANGITTTTTYEKHVYGFLVPVATEEITNIESGPADPATTGCCNGCNIA